ncbi:uncharacterized protein LOC121384603 [Gigantopelta aegis]|uniref:uncharacterized protein LOC121384603 n=1 Tax=Gigantopelta aegis TaxID=1735272 RepID=UPI001B8887A2|nr:uncharacterized protein LOC121384603 [Gigantopelta aegis]
MEHSKWIIINCFVLLELLSQNPAFGQVNILKDCITTCLFEDDGYYPDCEHCDHYIRCYAGRTFSRPCANGTKWNKEVGACTHKDKDDPCGAEDSAEVESPTSPTSVTSRTSGTSPTSVTSRTSGTSPTSVTSRTSGTSLTSLISRTSPTSLTSATSATRPTSLTVSTSNFCIRKCMAEMAGVFANCDDCKVFHMCSSGIIMNFTCGDGKLFDANDKRCMNESLATCGSVVQTSVQTHFKCINSCDDKDDGFYDHCNDCDKFILCSNHNVTIHSCPSEQHFNLKYLACLPECVGDECN